MFNNFDLTNEEIEKIIQKFDREIKIAVRKTNKTANPDYEQVISGLYFSGKNLRVVASEMHISERTVQRYRDAGIGELVEMYEVLSEAGLSPE